MRLIQLAERSLLGPLAYRQTMKHALHIAVKSKIQEDDIIIQTYNKRVMVLLTCGPTSYNIRDWVLP